MQNFSALVFSTENIFQIDGEAVMMKTEEVKIQWGTICECLPWEEKVEEENLRRYVNCWYCQGHQPLVRYQTF